MAAYWSPYDRSAMRNRSSRRSYATSGRRERAGGGAPGAGGRRSGAAGALIGIGGVGSARAGAAVPPPRAQSLTGRAGAPSRRASPSCTARLRRVPRAQRSPLPLLPARPEARPAPAGFEHAPPGPGAMFYSTQILAKKGPLGTIWIAAHLDRRLKRGQVFDADIGASVGE